MDNAKEHLVPSGIKLTMVTIYDGPWRRRAVFIPLPHDSRGHAIIAHRVYDEVLRRLKK